VQHQDTASTRRNFPYFPPSDHIAGEFQPAYRACNFNHYFGLLLLTVGSISGLFDKYAARVDKQASRSRQISGGRHPSNRKRRLRMTSFFKYQGFTSSCGGVKRRLEGRACNSAAPLSRAATSLRPAAYARFPPLGGSRATPLR